MTDPFSWKGFEIPDYMRAALVAYAEHHQPVGGFLRAVIANDLMEAWRVADENNVRAIPAYCHYLYWQVPGDCHGSYEAYNQWIAQRRPPTDEDPVVAGHDPDRQVDGDGEAL